MQRSLFDDEHRLFRETVQGFIARHVTPNLERYRASGVLDRELWQRAAEFGLLGLQMPEEFGGAAVADQRFVVVLFEELGRVALGLASSFGVHVDIVAPYLLELGTPRQQERWLPRFCSGELLTAIAITEPDAGSDMSGLKSSAVRRGDRWILNGSKAFITNGTTADLTIVVARTSPGRGGLTLFAVDSSTPGYSVGRKLAKLGQHEVDTAELSFCEVELSDDEVIGEVGGAWSYLTERLQRERLHSAYVNLAHVEAVFEKTLEYVTTRTAFGRAIGSFQHSRFALAEAAIALDVTRAYIDSCISAFLCGRLTPVDAAKAKFQAAEVQNRVIDVCLQMHGGYGYMEEYSVGRAWADARVTRIYAGTNEIMKEIVGRSLGLGEPRV